MNQRRTIRKFTDEEVSLEIINECVKAAGTAPSGANMQPWLFAIVRSPEMKARIREEAEKEEYDFYNKRNNQKWSDYDWFSSSISMLKFLQILNHTKRFNY